MKRETSSGNLQIEMGRERVMHGNRIEKWKCILFAAVILLAPAIAVGKSQVPSQPQQVTAPELTDSDCAKCHTAAPRDILAMGGGHRSAVGCLDCHLGHPPIVANNIPRCDDCHAGKAHYELENCLSCHTNPHKPLELTLKGDITDPCLTCHTGQIIQLREHQSAHTSLSCTACHDRHAKAPDCTNCHAPHSAEMTMADCSSCHQAHMPLQVTYADNIASSNCGSCHATAYEQLATHHTKHSELACAACHQEKHGTLMQCQECHGTPHAAGMLARFPNCGDCHSTAHKLLK
jgi:hypothetical protein